MHLAVTSSNNFFVPTWILLSQLNLCMFTTLDVADVANSVFVALLVLLLVFAAFFLFFFWLSFCHCFQIFQVLCCIGLLAFE